MLLVFDKFIKSQSLIPYIYIDLNSNFKIIILLQYFYFGVQHTIIVLKIIFY